MRVVPVVDHVRQHVHVATGWDTFKEVSFQNVSAMTQSGRMQPLNCCLRYNWALIDGASQSRICLEQSRQ